MRVTILAVGSRGDVQPYVALGVGFAAAGHIVRVATHASFEDLVRSHGLDFFPVRGNPRELLESQAGRSWVETGNNPVRFMRGFKQLMGTTLMELLIDSWQASRESEMLLYGPLAIAGPHIGEALRIPAFPSFYLPLSRTRAYPSVLFPPSLGKLGSRVNWLSHLVAEHASWLPLRSIINMWRMEHLEVAPLPMTGIIPRLLLAHQPILYGYSSTVLPKPAEWPAWIHVTGYWFLDRLADWQPAADLVKFLADGPPPIYVGLGSMTTPDRAALVSLVLDALKQTRQRCVLQSGWAGLSDNALPEHVLVVDNVPHDWLFPQMAAVVHHGGAGTTAAGLRAGVPTVTTPLFADQPFWGQRVADLRVGSVPIPHKHLTAARLATAIREVTSTGVKERAVALGVQIRKENGVANAVAAVHYHINNRRQQ